MTVPRTDRQHTSSHLPLRCDVFRSPTEQPVMWLRRTNVEAFRVHYHKQLIRPMLDYACPVWRSAPQFPCQEATGIQFKCLRIATNASFTEVTSKSWGYGSSFLYRPHQFSNRETRLKVSWCGEPLSYAARQISALTECWPRSHKPGRPGSTNCPGFLQKVAMSTYWIVPNWHFSTTLTEVFSELFSSLVRQTPEYNTQRRDTDRSLPRHGGNTLVSKFHRGLV